MTADDYGKEHAHEALEALRKIEKLRLHDEAVDHVAVQFGDFAVNALTLIVELAEDAIRLIESINPFADEGESG